MTGVQTCALPICIFYGARTNHLKIFKRRQGELKIHNNLETLRSTRFYSIDWPKTKMLKIAKIIDKVTLIKQLIIYNNLLKEVYKIVTFSGFPGGAVVKNPSASAGDTGSSPGLAQRATNSS